MPAPPSAPYPRDRQARLSLIRNNEEWVRRRIWQLEEAQVRELTELFRQARSVLNAQLVDVMRQYGGGEAWSVKDSNFRMRTEALMQQIQRDLETLTDQARYTTFGAMERGYRAGYYGRAWILDQALRGGSTLNLPLLPTEAIHAALLNPYGGLTFIDRYTDARDEFVRLIRRAIVGSQINGDSIPQAMKRLAILLGLDISRGGKDQGLRYRLEMIARTEILRASNMGAMQIYENNSDVLQGWEFVATNDERTCDECGAADGQQHAFDDEGDKPPLHPNCRCSVIPILMDQELQNRIVGPQQSYSQWAAANTIGYSDGGAL